MFLIFCLRIASFYIKHKALLSLCDDITDYVESDLRVMEEIIVQAKAKAKPVFTPINKIVEALRQHRIRMYIYIYSHLFSLSTAMTKFYAARAIIPRFAGLYMYTARTNIYKDCIHVFICIKENKIQKPLAGHDGYSFKCVKTCRK